MENRHEIKKRMISAAAKSWGITTKEMESVDPLITLLIDACASEIENISASVDEVRQKMGVKLMELLTPENLLSPVPSRAILHAHPFNPITKVNEDYEFYFHKKNPFDEENLNLEIFFTPVREHLLFNGNVKFIAYGNALYRMDEFNEKALVCNSISNKTFTDSLWIGLNINRTIESMNGLSFYFEIADVNDTLEKIFYQALVSSNWEINDKKIKVDSGYYDAHSENNKKQIKVPYTEFNKSFAFTNQVIEFFKKHFISFSENQWDTIINQEVFIKYPSSFRDLFNPKDLEAIDSKMLWVKVNFLHHVSNEILDHIKCSINCFPVINRRKEKSVIKGSDRIKELRTEAHEVFFDLKSITCDEDIEIILGDKAYENMEGKALLTLRKDNIGRMNTTNAVDKVQQLIEAYRNEYAAFSKIKGIDHDSIDKLHEAIRPFEYAIEHIRNYTAGSKPYLMLKTEPEKEDADVEVTYYLTNGSLGNGIKKGEHIHFDSAELIRDKIYFMTPTFGGIDIKKDEEMIRSFRYALLTRGKLVTMEDIRALCTVQFGKYAEAIYVQRGVDVDTQQGSGLRRIIEIKIKLEKSNKLSQEEIKFLKEDLEHQLMGKSTNVLPYKVVIN
jgi:hypothetical protein